eukprot:TRINITY_DN7655_c3_g1_i1.p1 TRINITY_DN7655_c3_g1~~TRINITY_DN7655_c3_g1_i1.p1  ORF type:complete len:3029 (+),score=615.62 TRINITY_DN7655_c3_g1_i1:50-9136(+)
MLGDPMETSSLQDALDKILSDNATTNNAGMDALQQWLQDTRNLERADGNPEVWPAVLKVLVKYLQRQVQGLSKSARKVASKADSAAVLLQAVRASCRSGRKPGAPRLANVQQRLWSHVEEVLRSEAVAQKQAAMLPYYCRVARELADSANLGTLQDLRGDSFRRIVLHLVQIQGSREALGAALDAATRLCQQAPGDPGAELPALCERALALLQSCNLPAASCIAASALRSPFYFRDWLLADDHLQLLVSKATQSWTRQTSEGLELTFRLGLGLGVRLAATDARTLLPLVASTLEALARDSNRSSGADRLNALRCARLADLMAVLALTAYESPHAAVATAVCDELGRRCLPWAMCLVRLLERQPIELASDSGALTKVLHTLQQQLARAARLSPQELAALHLSLAAALAAQGWSQLAPERQLVPVPVLCSSLCEGECIGSLTAPGTIELLPDLSTLSSQNNKDEWMAQLRNLVEYSLSAIGAGVNSRSFWQMLSALLVIAPATELKDLLRQFYSQQLAPRRSAQKSSSSTLRTCLLSALRRQVPEVDAQRELLQAIMHESLASQVACLRIWAGSIHPGASAAGGSLATGASDDSSDFLCAIPPPEFCNEDDSLMGSRSTSLQILVRREACFTAVGLEAEIIAATASFDAASSSSSSSSSSGVSGASGASLEVDEILLQRAVEAASLQQPGGLQQGSKIKGSRTLLLDTAQCSPGITAAWTTFEARLQEFRSGLDVSQPAELSTSLAASLQLLPAASLAILLPQAPGSNEQVELRDCCKKLIHFAQLLATSAPSSLAGASMPAAVDAFFNGLTTLLWNLSFSNHVTVSETSSLIATMADTLAKGSEASSTPTSRLRLQLALAVCDPGGAQSFRQYLLQICKSGPCESLFALSFATAELARQLQPCLHPWRAKEKLPGLADVLDATTEAWCACPMPSSPLEWESYFTSALRLLEATGCSLQHMEDGGAGVRQMVMGRLWNTQPRLATIVERLSSSFWPSARCKIALAGVLTLSVHFLGGLSEEMQHRAADSCMKAVPEFILTDKSSEVRLMVTSSCVRMLFQSFDDKLVYQEFAPVLESLATLGSELPAGTPPPSSSLAALQLSIEMAACPGYMRRVLPQICALPSPSLRPAARRALAALDGGCASSSSSLSPLALTLRAPIFLAYARAGCRLAHLPLAELGLAPEGPPLENPARGQRWGLGRHIGAAVTALALTEDLEQLSDLAPCCGHRPGSPEFEELLLVPLAGCLLPLRRSMVPLKERFGSQLGTKLKSNSADIFAFALQLPLLTHGEPRTVDSEEVATALREAAPQGPWTDTHAFVAKHFRHLLARLDPVLRTWAPLVPEAAVAVLRAVAGWAGPLQGSRLRLLLALMVRLGDLLPATQQNELGNIIGRTITASANLSGGEPLMRLARHRDETLRWILRSVERQWSVSSEARQGNGSSSEAESSPSLAALLALLRGLRRGNAGSTSAGSEWLHLQLEAMLPRLRPEVQRLVGDAAGGGVAAEAAAVAAAATSELGERPAKRLKRGATSTRLGSGAALRELAPPEAALAWGPPPSPDLGAIVRCLPDGSSSVGSLSGAGQQDAKVLHETLRLISQAQPTQQLRREPALARALASRLASLGPAAAARVSREGHEILEDAVELAVHNRMATSSCKKDQKRQAEQPQPPPEDELLCSGGLLGATQLQVHSSANVRHLAAVALQQLIGQQPSLCAAARQLLGQILDSRHLCLEDLDDLLASVAKADAKAIDSRSTSRLEGSSWRLVREEKDFSAWVCALSVDLLALGQAVWDAPALAVLDACVPLARHAAWFAERLLVLALLKAASLPRSGPSLAKALTDFFRRDNMEPAQTQCLLRALHLIRMHQTARKHRSVPHFPSDGEDPFWTALDLQAAASCAARVGRPQDGLLYMELHLQRVHPNLPIGDTLRAADAASASGSGRSQGVESLFRKPGEEVRLLHDLARQLPEDELLHGNAEWCHASSRLARAELGQEHLTSLHLRSELLEAALHCPGQGQRREAEDARLGLDDAIARLGLHPLLSTNKLPEEDAGDDAWERRMEALWRMQQWGDVPGVRRQGFHAGVHSALSAFTVAKHSSQPSKSELSRSVQEAAGPGAAVERPLLGLVVDVASGLQVQSLQLKCQRAIRFQMLGSVFKFVEALFEDSRLPQSTGRSVKTLAASWQAVPRQQAAAVAQHFLEVEPLYALQATLLAVASQPLEECRFLTSFASSAREASQAHRGLALLERAHRATGRASLRPTRGDLLRLHWEQARCLWELGQPQEAVNIARAVAHECRNQQGSRNGVAAAEERSWSAQVLSGTGLWLSLSKLESPETIEKEYLKPAVSMDPMGVQASRRFADFLDSRLAEELARQGSLQHSRAREARKRTEAEVARIDQELEAFMKTLPPGSNPAVTQQQDAKYRTLREQKRKLDLAHAEDRQQEKSDMERVKALALGCVEQFGRCLSIGSKENLTQVACRFLSIWFDYSTEYPEITSLVRELLPKLSLGPLSPFIYQLASRLDMKENPFQQTLDDLLVRLTQLGAHALYPLICLRRNGDKVPKEMLGSVIYAGDLAKVSAAKRVLDRVRKLQAVRPLLDAVETLNNFYQAIAFFSIDKKNRDVEVPLSQVAVYRDVRKAFQNTSIPVPTALPPVEGGPAPPHIQGFGETFQIAKQGVSCPRIVRVRDSTGKEHKQLVKGADDLRQDAVMQQLFRLLNDVFEENPKSRQAQLALRTFQVVPLSPCAGIAEWVDNTATLAEVLTGPNFKDGEGAHQRYRPKDITHAVCRQKMAAAFEASKSGDRSVQEKTIADIYENFQPVMHLVFLERFPSPAEWHKARQSYARSAAVSSIVGYIVGLGDRHPNNILYDKQTSDIVHIDFGITFEAGRSLKVPELVPFRLTRDMVAGLGCLGTCGLFRRCCETTMEVLRGSSPLVIAVAEVFVHDPLYFWSLTPSKTRRQSDAQPDQVSDGGPPSLVSEDGNEMATRALLAVKNKLLGESGTAALGVPAHVGRLIHEAMDTANLCRMWYGWSPWL